MGAVILKSIFKLNKIIRIFGMIHSPNNILSICPMAKSIIALQEIYHHGLFIFKEIF